MNDRFKFRTWDKDNKCFIKDKFYPLGSDYYLVLNQNGELFKLGLGDYNCSDIHSWGIFERYKNFEVNFCTGLKDRNGKLIYEGDIVRLDDELNCIAQFHKDYDMDYGRLEFILIGGHPKRPTIYIPTVAHESEIIGNIYTTPELLEEQF